MAVLLDEVIQMLEHSVPAFWLIGQGRTHTALGQGMQPRDEPEHTVQIGCFWDRHYTPPVNSYHVLIIVP